MPVFSPANLNSKGVDGMEENNSRKSQTAGEQTDLDDLIFSEDAWMVSDR